jgi:hypothetical protein
LRAALALVAVAACAHAPRAWPTPAGWKSETIAFPLDFAPALAHRGVEELRFAPGFFDPRAGGYWSYAFAWRLDDTAALDAAALDAELTAYFRGLVAAVNKELAVDAIAVRVAPAGDVFAIAAHVLDAFGTGAPVDLVGTATRRACGAGALWVFALAPATTTVRAELDDLVARARCK